MQSNYQSVEMNMLDNSEALSLLCPLDSAAMSLILFCSGLFRRVLQPVEN